MATRTSKRSKSKKVRVGILSLGCPRTLVDSEHVLSKLSRAGMTLAASVTDCDVALVNTCGFIQEAQQESVDRILELIELKNEKSIKALIVMGCMVQQFHEELRKELKEVDAFVGSGEYDKIPEIVNRVLKGHHVVSVGEPGYLGTSAGRRVALTPSHYRYLKISEGCDHECSFCVIPAFRGKHRSRSLDDVVLEARRLAAEGAKELIVTGQDTTYFGRDREGEFLLPALVRALDEIEGVEWVRLLYAYPSCVTRGLMDAIRDAKHVVPYLDMALQHVNDRLLQAMRRGITRRRTEQLIGEFRERVPGLAIRTAFIVGFPGETEEEFEELLAFMKLQRFERLGIFTFSPMAGALAGAWPDQIADEVKQERLDRAMRLQQEISRQNNEKWLGKTLRVLIDGQDERDPKLWVGRSYMDAPEVDGNVFIQTKKRLKPGQFVSASIISTKEYDLVGEI